jgi:hypothetical protein
MVSLPRYLKKDVETSGRELSHISGYAWDVVMNLATR